MLYRVVSYTCTMSKKGDLTTVQYDTWLHGLLMMGGGATFFLFALAETLGYLAPDPERSLSPALGYFFGVDLFVFGVWFWRRARH